MPYPRELAVDGPTIDETERSDVVCRCLVLRGDFHDISLNFGLVPLALLSLLLLLLLLMMPSLLTVSQTELLTSSLSLTIKFIARYLS